MTRPSIRSRAAIVGIGQSAFGRSLGRSEYDLALDAILDACEDAGLSPRALDGVARYDMETTDEEALLSALAAGTAETVRVFRSRARGKQSAFGRDPKLGGRYGERVPAALPGLNQANTDPTGAVLLHA